jgi:hypothetical protein
MCEVQRTIRPGKNDISLLPSRLHCYRLRFTGWGPTLLCQDDLQKGNLTQVLTSWRPKSVTFFAIHPGSQAMTAATRAFLDLLVTRTRHLDDDGR